MPFIVNQNVNDVVLVPVVTFAGVEEPVNREGFKSDSSSSKVSMKSKRGTYVSELNENINYGERTLKWGSGCRPLCLLEKRFDAMPSNSKVTLYR